MLFWKGVDDGGGGEMFIESAEWRASGLLSPSRSPMIITGAIAIHLKAKILHLRVASADWFKTTIVALSQSDYAKHQE